MSEEARNIIQLVVDSEGKLLGLVGDRVSHADCPVEFVPTDALIVAVRLALFIELNRAREDSVLFQLALDNLEVAWKNRLRYQKKG